jgi:small subunit ribosomal protein S4
MNIRKKPKFKIDRRLGVNLWGRPKSPFNKRETRPGEHGQVNRKPSDYSLQLSAKQKLKKYYGHITERQFKNYYKEASARKGDTGQILIELLERRLDAVLYRMKFSSTVFSSRQFVSHGHVAVNGKKINIPSYRINDGDEVSLSEKSKAIPSVILAVQSKDREIPEYLTVDYIKMKGIFVRTPALKDIPYPVEMEPNLVVEFYSR